MGNQDSEATPPDPYVEQALAAAGAAGGAYIETTGRTDLAAWTESEWLTLIEVIVSTFQEVLRTAYADDPPF